MFHPSLNQIAVLDPIHVDGAGAGINISLKNVHRAFLVAIIEQGVDATQHTISVKQSTGNAGSATGTDEKVLTNNCDIYYNENCEINNVLTKGTAAKNYTTDVNQSRTKMVVFDIVPAQCMDIANSFDCVTLDISDVGALNSVIMFAILDPGRYAPLPSVYAD